ncbi:MAG: sulfatase [Planctomycetota bacterium]
MDPRRDGQRAGSDALSRTLRVVAAAAVLLSAGAGCGGEPDEEPAKHLVVVVVDTLRADALGCYGAQGDVTPRIDALAAGGTLFECAQTPSTWTIPATVSLLSGMTPFEHGTTSRNFGRIPSDVPMLAEVLGEAGVRSAAVVCNPIVSAEYAFDRGFGRFIHTEHAPAKDAIDRALAWVEETAPGGERMFLYLHLFDPHWPYEPAPPEAERFGIVPSVLDRAEQVALASGMMAGDAELTRQLLEWGLWASEAYRACVASADREIGRLFDELDRLGVLESSVVVVTSDHGEEFGENGSLGHGRQLHRETLHVPLVLSGPGVPAGIRVPEPVPLRCIPATVLARMGLRGPSARLGADLIDDTARSWTVEQDQVAVLNFALWPAEDGAFRLTRHLMALRRGDRRLLWSFEDDFDAGVGRLVPLAEDLTEGEAVPYDAEPAGFELLAALKQAWLRAREPTSLEDGGARARRRAKLEQLGYVEATGEK